MAVKFVRKPSQKWLVAMNPPRILMSTSGSSMETTFVCVPRPETSSTPTALPRTSELRMSSELGLRRTPFPLASTGMRLHAAPRHADLRILGKLRNKLAPTRLVTRRFFETQVFIMKERYSTNPELETHLGKNPVSFTFQRVAARPTTGIFTYHFRDGSAENRCQRPSSKQRLMLGKDPPFACLKLPGLPNSSTAKVQGTQRGSFYNEDYSEHG